MPSLGGVAATALPRFQPSAVRKHRSLAEVGERVRSEFLLSPGADAMHQKAAVSAMGRRRQNGNFSNLNGASPIGSSWRAWEARRFATVERRCSLGIGWSASLCGAALITSATAQEDTLPVCSATDCLRPKMAVDTVFEGKRKISPTTRTRTVLIPDIMMLEREAALKPAR